MTLLQEFENISQLRIFEINIAEYLSMDLGVEEEYYVFHLNADKKGIYAGGCTNCGFKPYKGLFVDWDECYSLDEHLSFLYDKCVEWAIEDFENNLKGE